MGQKTPQRPTPSPLARRCCDRVSALFKCEEQGPKGEFYVQGEREHACYLICVKTVRN